MKIRIITAGEFLALLVISSVLPSFASSLDAIDPLLRLRGKEYRERVAQLVTTRDAQTIHDAQVTLDDSSAPQEKRLLAKIVDQRLSHREVFEEYGEHIRLLRERLHSQRPIGTRPGYIAGSLMVFAKQGVESRDFEEHIGWKETPDGMIQQTKTVRNYTEEEVKNSQARNRAARMAILEHFLKFAEEGSEYEQRELVDVVMRLWGEKSQASLDDGVPVGSLLEDISRDETRALSVRVSAMTRLPLAKRKGEQELMLTVLVSTTTDNETECQQVVRQAINYLKQHDSKELQDIATKSQWKRILIDESLGLPTRSVIKVSQDDEIIINVQE